MNEGDGKVKCSFCGGTGKDPEIEFAKCGVCCGTGYRDWVRQMTGEQEGHVIDTYLTVESKRHFLSRSCFHRTNKNRRVYI